MQRKILKTKSFVDLVPYLSSLPYRLFCYESHLNLFVCILQSLPSFPAGRIFALFGPVTESHTQLGHLQALCWDALFPSSKSRAPCGLVLNPLSRQ